MHVNCLSVTSVLVEVIDVAICTEFFGWYCYPVSGWYIYTFYYKFAVTAYTVADNQKKNSISVYYTKFTSIKVYYFKVADNSYCWCYPSSQSRPLWGWRTHSWPNRHHLFSAPCKRDLLDCFFDFATFENIANHTSLSFF